MDRSNALRVVVLAILLGNVAWSDDFDEALKTVPRHGYPGDNLEGARAAAKRYEKVIDDYHDHPRANDARLELVGLIGGFEDPELTTLGVKMVAEAIALEETTETATTFINFHVHNLRHDFDRDLPRCVVLAERMVKRLSEKREPVAELRARLLLGQVLIEQQKLKAAIDTLFTSLDRADEVSRNGDLDRDPLKLSHPRTFSYFLQAVVNNTAVSLGNLPERASAPELIPLIRREARKRAAAHRSSVRMLLKQLDTYEEQRRLERRNSGPSLL